MKSEICENCGVIHKGKWFNCKKFKPKNHTLSDDIIKELMKIEIVKENVALQNAIRMNIDFYVKEFIKQLKVMHTKWWNGDYGMITFGEMIDNYIDCGNTDSNGILFLCSECQEKKLR